MVELMNDNNRDKINILLQSNNCLNQRIISNCKIAYDIGLVIISSIILIMIYSIINYDYKAFTAIPLLILSGHLIDLHIIHMIMKFEFYMIEHVEKNLDGLSEENILSITRDLGIFRGFFSYQKRRKKHILFFDYDTWFRTKKLYLAYFGYVLSIILALFLNLIFKCDKTSIYFCQVFFVLYTIFLIPYIFAIIKISNEYDFYLDEIKDIFNINF